MDQLPFFFLQKHLDILLHEKYKAKTQKTGIGINAIKN